MSKRLIAAAALMGLTLAGSFARADSQDQRAQRQLKESFGLVVESSSRGGQEGVTVSEVLTDSAAERAGLREGDVIVQVGRRPIEDFGDLANAILRTRQRERVSFKVEHNGRSRTLSITRMAGADEDERDRQPRYGRSPDDSTNGDSAFQRMQQRIRRLESQMERQSQYGQARGDSADQEKALDRLQQRLDQLEERVQQAQRSGRYGRNTSGAVLLGVQTRAWRREAGSREGGSADEGRKIAEVDPDSPAGEAGLRRGDIITRVDNRNIATEQELRQALQRAGAGQEVTLEVLRGSRQMDVNVRLDGGSRYGSRDRQYQLLQQRIERLESRLREMEQNQ